MDKILVIEDDRNLRNTIKEILELNKYEILTAVDGITGIAKAIQFKPNIIICDIMMPEMDGFETLKNIRSIADIAQTPFIFLTAKTEKKDFREGMNLGADDFLNKPFNTPELLQVIKLQIKKAHKAKEKYTNEILNLKNEVGFLQNSIENLSYTNSHVLRAPILKVIGLINYMIDESTDKHNMDSKVLNMLRESCVEISDATIEVENLLNKK